MTIIEQKDGAPSTIKVQIPEGPLADKWTNFKDHQKLGLLRG